MSSCQPKAEYQETDLPIDEPFLIVLGVAQDAGYPQAGQQKEWQLIKEGKAKKAYAVSLGLIDPKTKQRWLIEATPDFKEQLQLMDQISTTDSYPYDGIFLTHAHIGHYTGLMHLGREAMGAQSTAVYAMPKMSEFLRNNGPWSQLVVLDNINIKPLSNGNVTEIGAFRVTPLIVPHRDEFSETVGFKIESNGKSILFIPDIDKWEKWDMDIKAVIKTVDAALLDASFFKNGEIPGRDMSEIPHPFVEESMALFENLNAQEKRKIHFIHFNHTNPLLFPNSPEHKSVLEAGFQVARPGQLFTFD
ncbi:pyrroloquinoline quinone biosynthesis protein PqqB [Roseivirga misakiensis]|uniref:Pyrroloquinoline quinone biosynthesis protein PqqB n=1 Tax=Roseivirga misakiensis TaxID=1563681 RepID=A0A1E5T7C9_9BACT|nr:pyrroloquinoline quinone biosynthesis protein PqqB [Roseivirga misakiensis]